MRHVSMAGARGLGQVRESERPGGPGVPFACPAFAFGQGRGLHPPRPSLGYIPLPFIHPSASPCSSSTSVSSPVGPPTTGTIRGYPGSLPPSLPTTLCSRILPIPTYLRVGMLGTFLTNVCTYLSPSSDTPYPLRQSGKKIMACHIKNFLPTYTYKISS